MDEDYQEFIENIKGEGNKHGVGLGFSEASQILAMKYILKGLGEHKLEETDKVFFPKVNKVIVKVAWTEKEDREEHFASGYHMWMIDAVFQEGDCECSPSEHFGFYCFCTDHGGSVTKMPANIKEGL